MPAKFDVALGVLADRGEPSYAPVLASHTSMVLEILSPDPSPAAIRRPAREHQNSIKEIK